MTLSDDDDYGIERLSDGNVQIKLGSVQPFDVPPATAIRLAALLCKCAGCDVLFRHGSMKVKFPAGFQFGNSEEDAPKFN